MSRLLEQLALLGSATVYEACGRKGLVDVPWRQIVPGSRIAGQARTVRCGQGDNLMVHAAMAQVQRGEVLVLTMPEPEPVALLGDLLATQAQVHGAAGVLVDAAVRDVEELERMALPVWSRYVSIRGAAKEVVGTVGEPVVVGGQEIHSGDVLVCDADGVVAVPAAEAERALALAGDREERERRKRERLRSGQLSYDLDGLRELVEEP